MLLSSDAEITGLKTRLSALELQLEALSCTLANTIGIASLEKGLEVESGHPQDLSAFALGPEHGVLIKDFMTQEQAESVISAAQPDVGDSPARVF